MDSLISQVEKFYEILFLQSNGSLLEAKAIDHYRLLGIICYCTLELFKALILFKEDVGKINYFLESDFTLPTERRYYGKFFLKCLKRAALLRHPETCRDLTKYYKARGCWGRDILLNLRACFTEAEARNYLREMEIASHRISLRSVNRKNLCKQLLRLNSHELPYGHLAFCQFASLAEKHFGGEQKQLRLLGWNPRGVVFEYEEQYAPLRDPYRHGMTRFIPTQTRTISARNDLCRLTFAELGDTSCFLKNH